MLTNTKKEFVHVIFAKTDFKNQNDKQAAKIIMLKTSWFLNCSHNYLKYIIIMNDMYC